MAIIPCVFGMFPIYIYTGSIERIYMVPNVLLAHIETMNYRKYQSIHDRIQEWDLSAYQCTGKCRW